jgi:Metallo-peptidase family M12B Reprolysin-like/Secretion system C-terminal sorting domain
MNRFLSTLLLCAVFLVPIKSNAGNLWQKVNPELAPQQLQLLHPVSFLVYTMDEPTLKLQMTVLSNDPAAGMVVSLPMPDGSFKDFRVWQTPVMPEELAARYPDIKTFTAEAVGNRNITAKLDFTLYGFHAMIYDGDRTSFIDPYDNYHDGYYLVHYKKDERRALSDRMKCLVHGHDETGPGGEPMDIVQKGLPKLAFKTINGYQLRTYRLALAADHFYCQAATGLLSPTIAQSLSKMTTSLNRVNGVYEREISVTFNFCANEDLIIWTVATGGVNGDDPFNAIDASAIGCLSANQTQCDTRIGTANYDFGHVFTTGAGGYSLLGIVCTDALKAQSVTGSALPVGDGFDIDYVVHEFGHEFGADHTFNNNADGSCATNIETTTAYEPGSGSTIMAYAGICGPDDIQPHSDAYFHAISLLQMQHCFTTTAEVCAVKTSTGNKLVQYAAFDATYSIPYLTPFELYAPALTDSVGDSAVLFCWEQWDLGDAGQRFIATHTNGPIFRSFNPTNNNLRIFPTLNMVLAGTLSNAGTENAQGEKAPDVARTLHFKCTFRDIINNHGAFTFPDDQITLNAINTGAGFKVTSQGTAGLSYVGHSTQTVTWDVVTTNVAPINAANVEIFMSVDGGHTWLYHIGTFPNTGSASVTVPNPGISTINARFKVKGAGNVFFNLNSVDFIVTYNSAFPIDNAVKPVSALAADVKLYPVPATGILHVATTVPLPAVVYNAIGQQVWKGELKGTTDINIAAWARGLYYMQLTGSDNERAVKKFVVE